MLTLKPPEVCWCWGLSAVRRAPQSSQVSRSKLLCSPSDAQADVLPRQQQPPPLTSPPSPLPFPTHSHTQTKSLGQINNSWASAIKHSLLQFSLKGTLTVMGVGDFGGCHGLPVILCHDGFYPALFQLLTLTIVLPHKKTY